jgi:probable F420-dependent oxidoreductase
MPTTLAFSLVVGRSIRLDAHALARYAARAEELGFRALYLGDHLYLDNPTGHAPLIAAVLATATERIPIGFCAYVLPLRHPLHAAKELAELDRLSDGRLIAGLAAGSNAREFARFGIPFEERGARLDEGLEIVLRLWTGEPVTHEGRFYQIHDATLGPAPVRRPHPPIWFGSWTGNRRNADRIVHLAAGWQASGLHTSVDEFRAGLQHVHAAAKRAGRDPASIGISYVNCIVWLDSDRDRAWDDVRSGRAGVGSTFRSDIDLRLIGTPDDVIARLEEVAAAGILEVAVLPPVTSPEQIEIFAREVMPAFASP